MENSLRGFEKRVPPPKLVPHGRHETLRYVEKTIHQAIVQKLARVVSGLHAARILLAHGYIQELGSLHRMLDEFHEDITFLCLAVIYDDLTELHTEYLEAFFQEEFDKPDDPVGSTQNRPMIPRKKIRAYIANSKAAALEPSCTIQLSKTISKTYSGFVHGASPHIMDMYGGSPAKFHVKGLLGTPRMKEYERDIWNYFYRSIIAFAFSAKAFGAEDLFKSIRDYRDHFEAASGEDYSSAKRKTS